MPNQSTANECVLQCALPGRSASLSRGGLVVLVLARVLNRAPISVWLLPRGVVRIIALARTIRRRGECQYKEKARGGSTCGCS